MMKKITIQRMAAMLTASALLLMMAACGNSPAKEETPLHGQHGTGEWRRSRVRAEIRGYQLG